MAFERWQAVGDSGWPVSNKNRKASAGDNVVIKHDPKQSYTIVKLHKEHKGIVLRHRRDQNHTFYQIDCECGEEISIMSPYIDVIK